MDHGRVNEWLASVALGLAIVCMVVFLYGAARVQSALSGLGGGEQPPVECWDPGGGEVCAPGGQDGLPGAP
jgi:hypothetical protein